MPGAEAGIFALHRFAQPALLREALTHRSHSTPHNERLEFIGDGVLDCVIALELFRRFPQLPEGDLSRLRAQLVRAETLAELAGELQLGRALRLGEGEARSGGAQRPSILADALEAVFGAIMLDAGFDTCKAVIERLYAPRLQALDPERDHKDPKTRLQEFLQARRLPLPEYQIRTVHGEAHAQQFEVECRIRGLADAALGIGTSRRAAEQAAAEACLRQINA